MVAELLSHELGAPARTESAHGPGDGLPDLSATGLVAALQHRHEQGVGPDSADAGLVCRWLHREPPREMDPRLLRRRSGHCPYQCRAAQPAGDTCSLPRTRSAGISGARPAWE